MKLYYIKTHFGNELIDAKTLKEAKDLVKDGYSNCGVKKITCVRFKKIESKDYMIDTDCK